MTDTTSSGPPPGDPTDPGRPPADLAPAERGDPPAAGAWPPDEALEAVELDEHGLLRRDLEGVLLVADEPVAASVLAEVVGARLSQVEELLVALAGEYARDSRGFVLRAVAGGWRLYTHPGAAAAVESFLRAGQQSRLTRAALETLAVIAYRQPVTRFQVAAVRGVNVDGGPAGCRSTARSWPTSAAASTPPATGSRSTAPGWSWTSGAATGCSTRR